MKIHLAKSIGEARTKLGAFDKALNLCGIQDRNLIYLSSVVPPLSEIVEHDKAIPDENVTGTWGDRQYVVMAEMRTAEIGERIAAGIGWWQFVNEDGEIDEQHDGRGLFVEHVGESEDYVKQQIIDSLIDLRETRGIPLEYGRVSMSTIEATCGILPVSVMVVATYQSSDWDNNPSYNK